MRSPMLKALLFLQSIMQMYVRGRALSWNFIRNIIEENPKIGLGEKYIEEHEITLKCLLTWFQ